LAKQPARVVDVWVYGLVDPRTDQIRYVGQSVDPVERLAAHLEECYQEQSEKAEWIQELKKLGLVPRQIILERTTSELWEEREQYWIAKCKAIGEPLVNTTAGGFGLRDPSPKVRQKCGVAGKKHAGQATPPEVREKIAATMRARYGRDSGR